MKNRLTLAFLLLLAIWFGGWLGSLFPPDIGVVILKNESDHHIRQAVIMIRELELNLGPIPADGFAVGRYDVPGDSHYDIRITFESEKEIRAELGYMTSGMDSFDVIEVRNDSIAFSEPQPSVLSVRPAYE